MYVAKNNNNCSNTEGTVRANYNCIHVLCPYTMPVSTYIRMYYVPTAQSDRVDLRVFHTCTVNVNSIIIVPTRTTYVPVRVHYSYTYIRYIYIVRDVPTLYMYIMLMQQRPTGASEIIPIILFLPTFRQGVSVRKTFVERFH